MVANHVEISVKGRMVRLPAIQLGGTTIVVSGGWLKTASVRDEEWLEAQAITEPESVIEKLKQKKLNADIFTFCQRIPNGEKQFNYPAELDNVAAIETSDHSKWWKGLPQVTRKNVRRAEKRGLVVKRAEFGDQLLRGIVEVNNETPLRQGRPFWHYGKSLEVVKKDYSTFLDRCEFIGAYYEDRLVGFVKMIYMEEVASILQILCMNKHFDKRPANALMAKAVEICHEKGIKHLVYGKYIYGKNATSPLTRFKRSNGFKQVFIPRYYIPLTMKGNVALKLGLHHGWKQLLPDRFMVLMRSLRAKWYEKKLLK